MYYGKQLSYKTTQKSYQHLHCYGSYSSCAYRGWKQQNNPVWKRWLSGKIQLKTIQWRRKWSCSPLIIHSPEKHTLSANTLQLSVPVIQPLPPPPLLFHVSRSVERSTSSSPRTLMLPPPLSSSPPHPLNDLQSLSHTHALSPQSFKVRSTVASCSFFPHTFALWRALHLLPPCSSNISCSLHHCWTLTFRVSSLF